MFTYKLYRHPDPHSGYSYIRDEILMIGFSFPALIFPAIWALWASLWIQFLVVVGANIIIFFTLDDGMLHIVTTIVVNLVIGTIYAVNGDRWRASSLTKKGYNEIYSIKAKSLSDAKIEFQKHNNRLQATQDPRT